jgi:hypothetical protein
MPRDSVLHSRSAAVFAGVGIGILALVGLFARPAPRPRSVSTAAAFGEPATVRLRHVTREGVGERWPLAVGEADVGCDGPGRTPRLFVLVDGVRYGLNANASNTLGYADLARATTADRRPLWRAAPTPRDVGASRVSTRALADEARDLCHP